MKHICGNCTHWRVPSYVQVRPSTGWCESQGQAKHDVKRNHNAIDCDSWRASPEILHNEQLAREMRHRMDEMDKQFEKERGE
jgi:hypothetical protein